MDYKVCFTENDIKEYVENSGILFVDTETTGLNPRESKIRLIQLKNPNKSFSLIIDFYKIKNAENTIYKSLKGKKLVFHNAKFDLHFLYNHINKEFLNEDIEDTMLIGKCYEIDKSASLKEMVKRHLEIEISKEEQKSDWNNELLTEEQLKYASQDVFVLERLYRKLEKKYDIKNNFIYKLEKSFIPVLIKIEESGIKIDFEKALDLLEKTREKYYKIEEYMTKKYNLNPRSPNDIAQALIKEGINLPKTKKGNFTTSEDVLKFIDHEIAKNIINLRKLKNSIDLLESYIMNCDSNYRVHSTFHSWRTVSGRMSSQNPNIQNVPANETFRSLFIHDEGNVLIGADYPQIELRIAAKYTGDKTMIDSFKNNIDLHKLIVAKATGKNYEEISDEERKLGKPINFGLLYGMSAKTLKIYAKTMYGLDISDKEAKEFKRIYKETYKGINEWQDKTIRKIKKDKFIETETLAGRKAIAKRFTDALNYPIQGSGADMIKLACVYFDYLCKKHNVKAFIVNIIHDEIIIESSIDDKNKAKTLLKTSMEKAAKKILKDIPCPVDILEGENWNEIKD